MATVIQPNLKKLKSTLAQSKIRENDLALFQVVDKIIDATRQLQIAIDNDISIAVGGLAALSYYTQDDETFLLPNSKQIQVLINQIPFYNGTTLVGSSSFTFDGSVLSAPELLVGTTIAISAGVGDIVLPNNTGELRAVNAAGTDTYSLIKSDSSNRIVVGINTTIDNNYLEFIGTGFLTGNDATDLLDKSGRILGKHYNNSEEPILIFQTFSSAALTALQIGGGTGLANAVMDHRFYTAPNTTTVVGTERMRLSDPGILTLGTTVTTSAGAGDIVLPNNTGELRSVAASGIDTISLIKLNSTDQVVSEHSVNGPRDLVIRNPNTGAAATSRLFVGEDQATGKTFFLQYFNASYTPPSGLITANRGFFGVSAGGAAGLVVSTLASAPILFATGGIAVANERLRIDASGVITVGGVTQVTSAGVGDIVLPNATGEIRAVTSAGTDTFPLIGTDNSNQVRIAISGAPTVISGTLGVTGGSATVAGLSMTKWFDVSTSGLIDGDFVHGLAFGTWKSIGYEIIPGQNRLAIGGYKASQWQAIGFYTGGAVRVIVDNGGKVGIGAAPATSAILELSSTTGALLVTRLTTVQRDALTAVDGMVIYNSTLGENQVRQSGSWVSIGAGGINQLTGDVTAGPGSGSQVATIPNNIVTNAKLADMATARIRGRVTAGSGDPEDLTGTQATTLLDAFTSALKGLVPPSGGGTSTFLRADATFAAVPTADWTEVKPKSADQDVVGVTLTTATDLVIAVLAGQTWCIEVLLMYSGDGTTQDYKFAFNVSAGAIQGVIQCLGLGTTDVVSDQITSAGGATSGALNLGVSGTAGTPRNAIIKAIFRCSANANLNFQFAQVSASGVTFARTFAGTLMRGKLL